MGMTAHSGVLFWRLGIPLTDADWLAAHSGMVPCPWRGLLGSPEDKQTLPPITGRQGGSMVRLARNVCIVILTVHLAVGCCANRARRCENKRVSWATHRDTVFESRCTECRCSPPHHGPGHCKHDKRSTPPRRRPAGGSSSPLISASFAVLSEGRIPRCAWNSHQPFHGLGRRLLSVRLHLANQVLLI